MKKSVYLIISVFILSGCASKSTAPNPDRTTKIGGAVIAPLEDLNLVRTKIPLTLVMATEHPYRDPADRNCETIITDVVELNEALGPDLDARKPAADPSLLKKGGTMAEESAIDALSSTTKGVIPFRSWVRKLTGAERHSREVANAITAGIVRRAYLKGLGESLGCESPAAPLPLPPAVEEKATAPEEPDSDLWYE